MLSYTAAQSRALLSGATQADIDHEFDLQARQRGTTPHRNMVRALQLLPHLNTREDWTRLAAALRPQD